MKRIRDVAGQDLVWSQPRTLKSFYELRAGDNLVATLTFRTGLGSLATAESADGIWTFKRVGFFKPTVTIRAQGSDVDLAVFRNNTWRGGGTLDLPSGRQLLATTNFWQTRYEFMTSDDRPLLTYRRTPAFLHLSAAVDIHDPAAAVDELPWLVMLGWYLKVLLHRDASGAAAVAASA